MASIMKNGDTVSKVFQPRARFGVSVRVHSGTMPAGCYIQHSTDNTNWVNSHEDDFGDDNPTKKFEIPDGFYCRFDPNSNANLIVDIGYLPVTEPRRIDIDKDIL